MNRDRRDELNDVCDYLMDAIERLQEIRDDEQDDFDDLSYSQATRREAAYMKTLKKLNEFDVEIQNIHKKIYAFANPQQK